MTGEGGLGVGKRRKEKRDRETKGTGTSGVRKRVLLTVREVARNSKRWGRRENEKLGNKGVTGITERMVTGKKLGGGRNDRGCFETTGKFCVGIGGTNPTKSFVERPLWEIKKGEREKSTPKKKKPGGGCQGGSEDGERKKSG